MRDPDYSDQQLIDEFFRLEKRLEEFKEAYKKQCEPYNTAILAIKGTLHERLNQRGAKHTSVAGGTCYKVMNMTTKTTSRQAYLQFCIENPDVGLNLLTANVSKDYLSTFMEAHDNQPPPGVEVNYVETVTIRST